MTNLRSICVYCASRNGTDPTLLDAARELGQTMAAQNLNLVYGGASDGLMGAIADSVLGHGGYVVGVMTHAVLRTRQDEHAHSGVSEYHLVESMHDRKRIMIEKADAFIVLPGGFGTLDETFEIITWKSLGMHRKPIVILNLNGFYDPLITLIEHLTRQGVVVQKHLDTYTVATSVEEALAQVRAQAAAAGNP